MVIPESEVKLRFSRSSGPGGQNVNKRDTQVEVLFDVANSPSLGPRQRSRIMSKLGNRIDSAGVLHLVVSDERTQGRNRGLALERFAALIDKALKPDPPKRRPSRPSKAAVERRLDSKKRRSSTKRHRAAPRDDD